MQGRGLSFHFINLIFISFSQAPSLSLSTSFSLQKLAYSIHIALTTRFVVVKESFNWYQEPWFHPRSGGFMDLWVVLMFMDSFCQFWFFFSLVDLVLVFYLVFLWYFLVQEYSRIISHHLVSYKNLFREVQRRFWVLFLLAV